MSSVGRSRRAVAGVLALALVVLGPGAAAVHAVAVPRVAPPAAEAQTPKPTPKPTRKPQPTDAPAASTEPSASPEASAAPGPEQTSLTIGYRLADLAGRAPLLLAIDREYFTDAGFLSVTLMEAGDPMPGVLNGELDFGIVDTLEAVNGFNLGLPIQAVAGYRNATADPAASLDPGASLDPATSGPDLVAANTDYVTGNPNTIRAFTEAYIRALRDLGDPATNAATNEQLFLLAEAAGIILDDAAKADWPNQAATFAPYDGGYGAVDQGGGLGELEAYLTANLVEVPDMSAFLSWTSLNEAQAVLGLGPNPDPEASPDSSPGPDGSFEPEASVAPAPEASVVP